MTSIAVRLARSLRVSPALGVQRNWRSWYATTSFEGGGSVDDDDDNAKDDNAIDDDFLGDRQQQLQGVDPKRGWGFRGVHKAIVCGKVGQAPVQKILRNGNTVTIFTVGTGGMFDQRIVGARGLPKPAQWHRIAVHNRPLGAYAVQQLTKNSSVYVEGDIEVRVYNDSITGEVKNIPEICVRRDGRIRLVKGGESINNIPFDELQTGFFSLLAAGVTPFGCFLAGEGISDGIILLLCTPSRRRS